MFNKLLKGFPAEFIYGGYCVRKSNSVLTTAIDHKMMYDVFVYTYVDNFLTFFVLMEDGKYMIVENGKKVDEISGEDLVSRHIYRGDYYDTSQLEQYDKNVVIGVFGLRKIEDIFDEIEAMEKESGSKDMNVKAMYDVKNSYSGMEVMSIIKRFNKNLGWRLDQITIPAIKIDQNDTYESVIGDEMDFFDFMSDKNHDQIIKDFKELADNIDGVGNLKEDGINTAKAELEIKRSAENSQEETQTENI